MKSGNFFGTVVCAILISATSCTVALAQKDTAADRLLTGDGEDSPPSSSETMADQSQCGGCCDVCGWRSYCCPQLTASADFIFLDRIGGVNHTLVGREPHNSSLSNATEVLNSSDLHQGFDGGPMLDLIRHGDCGYDLELLYFQIDGWGNAATIEPNGDLLVFTAPGDFLQYNEGKGMEWQYSSRLYNAEFNVRWNPCCRVTALAGFRWIDLRENLVGALEPPVFRWEPPFWNTTTTNNLFGFQIGADGKILERGRFSIDALVKTGIFDNSAEEATGVGIIKIVRPTSASTNHAAFVGETGLQCKYQVAKGLLLRAGYEAIWLQGVALAPDRFRKLIRLFSQSK